MKWSIFVSFRGSFACRGRVLLNAGALLLVLQVSQARAQLFVSPSGLDTNPGTEGRPLRSLEKARQLARERKQGSAGDFVIHLMPGVYRLASPLRMDAGDSGTSGHNIVYEGTGKASATVISGAVQVRGWKLVDRKRSLWSADVPAAVSDSRQMYIDGVRATRTRGLPPVKLTKVDAGYVASDDSLSHWRHPEGLEFVYTGGNEVWSDLSIGFDAWTEPRCRVAKIEASMVTMAQPCWNNSTRRVTFPNSHRVANLVGEAGVKAGPTYIENAYELLGTPGQWYMDPPSATAMRKIYYVPREGEDLQSADVEIPILQSLLQASGSADHPLHHLVFRNLAFEFATWLGPNGGDGFSEIQANYQVTGEHGYDRQGLCDLVDGGTCPFGAWTKTPGNIAVAFGHQIVFERDMFAHLGAVGLDLSNGTQDTIVRGSLFTDISANGLQLGGVDDPLAPDSALTTRNQITDNLFNNVAAEFHGGVGIFVGYASETEISHNELCQLPYSAISIGWGGWPDKIKKPGIANSSHDNVLADNLIHDDMLLLSVGGGIYTQGRTGRTLEDGEKITGNILRDQFSSGHALFTDNGSSMITIRDNVLVNTNFDNWGVTHQDFYDGHTGENFDPLLIENNYWQQAESDSTARNVTKRNNHIVASLDEAPRKIVAAAGIRPEFRGTASMILVRSHAPDPPSRVAVAAGKDSAYVTWSPPLDDGGSPITAYTVLASNGASATIPAEDFSHFSFLRMSTLPHGLPMTFTVRAQNEKGSSPASIRSSAITPAATTLPAVGAPLNVSALAAPGGKVSLHFQSPARVKADTSPILGYVATVSPGGRKIMISGRNILVLYAKHVTFAVIEGLTPGETYTFGLAAVTEAGEGAVATTAPVTMPQAREPTAP